MLKTLRPLAPGLALCATVSLTAAGVQWGEEWVFGRAWLESLVLAIVIGAVVRSLWTPGRRCGPGMEFSARTLLEVAVLLLGAALDPATLHRVGPGLVAGIGGVVLASLTASYAIGRAFGLPHRMAVLVACGNSICGNSAIAATAPAIGAKGDEVASAIAFTAVLGVAVVLGLPLLAPLLGFNGMQYGVLAGLTVYAVPQVLPATAPLGALSMQVGTLVKLVRVLMLGPVVLVLSVVEKRRGGAHAPVLRAVPWFIPGFFALAALRAAGLIPAAAADALAGAATVLTVLSMAALGLGVDVRMVARAGVRVVATVTLSLAVLGGIGIGLIRLLGIA